MQTRQLGRARRETAARLAETQEGVVSRALLRANGIDRYGVRAETTAGRWRLHGRQTVAVHTGPLGATALRWRAVWEVGAGIAALDGATALEAAGMTGFTTEAVEVSFPHGSRVEPVDGVVARSVIAREPGELAGIGIPRVLPHVAALRAASWAVSDRQGALVLCMGVQQRIVTASALTAALPGVALWKRRAFISRVVADLTDGATALGEIDFAEECRARGLPEPTRQAVRETPTGRIYLDAAWEDCGLVAEIDGSQHRQGLAVMDDNLRQNEITLGGERVLRIDLVGWRLARERFMDQLQRGLLLLARA